VAIAALCQHNSRGIGLPPEFDRSAAVFARKWRHRLPAATACVIIDSGLHVRLLGNARDGESSVALAVRHPPRRIFDGGFSVASALV
jgi:hypothetical protein